MSSTSSLHHGSQLTGGGPPSLSEKLGGTAPLAISRSDSHLKMFKFSLYETASRFFLVGSDVLEQQYRVLKIERTPVDAGSHADTLDLSEDGTVYTRPQREELLATLDEGNRAYGGLKLRCPCWGLLGFIRFTGSYYMLVITKRSQVAMIGGHYVYKIEDTQLISLGGGASAGSGTGVGRQRAEAAHPEESRFLSIFNVLDLSTSFYYSHSYDMTNTLQHNLAAERAALAAQKDVFRESKYNDMFVWNRHLLEPAARILSSVYEWCVALIHGFVDQAKLSVFGRPVYLTVIARRSRYFAGARFLKRGANDLGYVANDVETEQIASEMQTTPFHAPGPKPFANPGYTSYVQHRGSIPLHWSQDNSGVSPKPDIDLNLVDPFYTAAALHFNNLFERYGAPIYVVNLVKSRERTPRESKLLKEFYAALTYLNQFLPEDKKIIYKPFDMSRASKSDQDVIGILESIAGEILAMTGFFHNGDDPEKDMILQNGVSRTNCIDCLDRTNAAQSVIGKVALGYQLHALGILDTPQMDYDTDVVNLFTHMYHDHGDTIAVQYGGSHLVNTMATYRKTNQWSSQSRDMVESLRRYVNNSFLDAQRQEAYNLFLGNYIFAQGHPLLWDLPSDYHLHHANPRLWAANRKRNYINWYNKDLLEDRCKKMAPLPRLTTAQALEAEREDDYWPEYYRPLALTSFGKLFVQKLQTTLEYVPYKSTHEGIYDPSPFRVRLNAEQSEEASKATSKKSITIIEPAKFHAQTPMNGRQVQKESQFPGQPLHPLANTAHPGEEDKDDKDDKTAVTQRALNQLVRSSLHPAMTAADLEEYSQYVTHPTNLSLAASAEGVASSQTFEYASYVQIPSLLEGLEIGHLLEEDLAVYADHIIVEDEPLTIKDEDLPKKRYTAYRKWLRGKSLFKQSRIDPEDVHHVP